MNRRKRIIKNLSHTGIILYNEHIVNFDLLTEDQENFSIAKLCAFYDNFLNIILSPILVGHSKDLWTKLDIDKTNLDSLKYKFIKEHLYTNVPLKPETKIPDFINFSILELFREQMQSLGDEKIRKILEYIIEVDDANKKTLSLEFNEVKRLPYQINSISTTWGNIKKSYLGSLAYYITSPIWNIMNESYENITSPENNLDKYKQLLAVQEDLMKYTNEHMKAIYNSLITPQAPDIYFTIFEVDSQRYSIESNVSGTDNYILFIVTDLTDTSSKYIFRVNIVNMFALITAQRNMGMITAFFNDFKPFEPVIDLVVFQNMSGTQFQVKDAPFTLYVTKHPFVALNNISYVKEGDYIKSKIDSFFLALNGFFKPFLQSIDDRLPYKYIPTLVYPIMKIEYSDVFKKNTRKLFELVNLAYQDDRVIGGSAFKGAPVDASGTRYISISRHTNVTLKNTSGVNVHSNINALSIYLKALTLEHRDATLHRGSYAVIGIGSRDNNTDNIYFGWTITPPKDANIELVLYYYPDRSNKRGHIQPYNESSKAVYGNMSLISEIYTKITDAGQMNYYYHFNLESMLYNWISYIKNAAGIEATINDQRNMYNKYSHVINRIFSATVHKRMGTKYVLKFLMELTSGEYDIVSDPHSTIPGTHLNFTSDTVTKETINENGTGRYSYEPLIAYNEIPIRKNAPTIGQVSLIYPSSSTESAEGGEGGREGSTGGLNVVTEPEQDEPEMDLADPDTNIVPPLLTERTIIADTSIMTNPQLNNSPQLNIAEFDELFNQLLAEQEPGMFEYGI